MSNKVDFSFKTQTSIPEASRYLSDIANSIKSKRVSFKSDESAISITPTGLLDIEIYAEQKKNKEKIIFEISWKLEEEEIKPTSLEINSKMIEENKAQPALGNTKAPTTKI